MSIYLGDSQTKQKKIHELLLKNKNFFKSSLYSTVVLQLILRNCLKLARKWSGTAFAVA